MKNILFYCALAIIFFSCSSKDVDKNILADKNNWLEKSDATISDESVLELPNKEAEATYNKTYKNIELLMECKTSPNAIAGIWIHTNPESGTLNSGYEVLINNNIESTEWRKSGSLSNIRNFGKRVVNNDEWFPVKIQIAGKQIKVFVNDVWIVDYTEPSVPYRTDEYKNRLFGNGKIAFVNHSDNKVLFKNIRVTELDDNLQSDNANKIDEQADDIIRLQQDNFPLIDNHIHLKGGISKEQAAAESRRLGITYGVAPNCGLNFPITSDADIKNFLDSMKHQPFYLPMQAEGREWVDMFSEEAMKDFDYRFTDALTWSDDKGRRMRIWLTEETFIDDEQKFMDMLVGRAVGIITNEPFDIFVNPTFLPQQLQPKYDELWTEPRMQRIINALLEKNIALEINNVYSIPSARLIKQAKASGVKFTFGTNNIDSNLGQMEHAIKMIKECGLTKEDIRIMPSKNI